MSSKPRTLYYICLLVGTVLLDSGCSTLHQPAGPGISVRDAASEFERQYSIARLTERRGDRAAARAIYERLLEQSPTESLAKHRLGVICGEEGDLATAVGHLLAARAGGLATAELDVDLGFAHLLAGNFAAAEIEFQSGLAKQQNDQRALNNLAILRAAQGRFHESLALSQQAVGRAKAQANLGYLLSQFGEVEAAVQSYHNALAQDQDLKVAAQALLQLEPLTQREQPPNPPAETGVKLVSHQEEVVPTTPKSTIVEAPQRPTRVLKSPTACSAAARDENKEEPIAQSHRSHLAPVVRLAKPYQAEPRQRSLAQEPSGD